MALATMTCVSGLAGLRLVGAYNGAGWLAFMFVLGSAIVALVAKTVLRQPLDSHLLAPLESFVTLAAGSAVLLVALLVALTIPVGKPLFHPVSDPRLLRWLSNSTFVLGTLSWYLNRLFQDPGGSGFGGLGDFWNLLLMAVIARTALVLEVSRGRGSMDSQLLLILAAVIAMGLVDNAKTNVALPVVAYFATSLFYRGGVTRWQTAAGVLGVVLMGAVVGPLIHAYRAIGIQTMPWQQRVQVIQSGLKQAFGSGRFERYQQLASVQFRSSTYNYFGNASGQMLVGRYATVQVIDPVIDAVNRRGALGGSVVWPAFARLVPSFIYPEKPRYPEAYYLLLQLGLNAPGGGKYMNVPLLAQSYAGYGAAGLILIAFSTFLGFLLALKKLGWELHRNVFAIFFFCVFTVVYANQGDLLEYAGSVLRSFPLLAAMLWLLIGVYRATHLFRGGRVAATAGR
ncbi:MAG TPA: hypothetical protein VE201_10300 [Nitrospirales bacterium]|nr:hypothetical protein [Nitrospirales bacterium]